MCISVLLCLEDTVSWYSPLPQALIIFLSPLLPDCWGESIGEAISFMTEYCEVSHSLYTSMVSLWISYHVQEASLMTAEQDTDLLVYQNVRGHIVAMFFWRSNRTWFFPRSHGLFSLRLLATLTVLGMVSVSRGGRGKCEQRSVGYSHRIYATITTLAYLTGL